MWLKKKKMRRGSALEAVGFFVALPAAVSFPSLLPRMQQSGVQHLWPHRRGGRRIIIVVIILCVRIVCLNVLSVYHVGVCLKALGPEDGVRSHGIEVSVLRIEPGSSEITASALNWCKPLQTAVRSPHLSSAPSSLRLVGDRPVIPASPAL